LDSLVDRQAWAWLYAVNIYIAKHGERSFSYLDHFSPLAIEEHFYLFWALASGLLAGAPAAHDTCVLPLFGWTAWRRALSWR